MMSSLARLRSSGVRSFVACLWPAKVAATRVRFASAFTRGDHLEKHKNLLDLSELMLTFVTSAVTSGLTSASSSVMP